MYKINQKKAKKLWFAGRPIWLCPCNIKQPTPAHLVTFSHWKESAEWAEGDESLWKGSVEETAWHLMYEHWKVYNGSQAPHYFANGARNGPNHML